MDRFNKWTFKFMSRADSTRQDFPIQIMDRSNKTELSNPDYGQFQLDRTFLSRLWTELSYPDYRQDFPIQIMDRSNKTELSNPDYGQFQLDKTFQSRFNKTELSNPDYGQTQPDWTFQSRSWTDSTRQNFPIQIID
ncbi:hypothetical protein ACJMK2_012404 [Sinanodonta woodiana]|uniref:Uncharacterized protein n=1 Tax=Sinanodonta woodiana TaxID=1069815 RepID=A0ABD3V847_SINWO